MAANFKGHKFIKTGVEDLTKLGFNVGAKVVVTKRFTVDYDPEKPNKCRKDVVVGTECFIKGFVPDTSDESKSRLVINFEATFGKNLKSVDVALDPAKLRLPPDSIEATGVKTGEKALFKKFPYLELEGDDRTCEVVASWSKRQMSADAGIKSELKKYDVGFVIDNLTQSLDIFTDQDLLIVRRVKSESVSYEVWTLRKFKAEELVLLPGSTQLLTRHYTAGRSVVVQNTLDFESKEDRPLILDGRIRANPMPDSKSSFSLYWMVAHTDVVKHINMVRSYVKTTCEVKMETEDQSLNWYQYWSETDMPSVPVLLNPKAIDANTQLLAGVDAKMQKIIEKDLKSKEKDKAKKGFGCSFS